MKKLLALVLALVMSMSLVTISNAAFKDADKIDYKEAVDVMNAVGVFIGDEKGNFNAKDNLTREQAAKIIAYLELGEKAADALVGSATFTDVAATRWSAGFVSYCAQAGVVSGNGDGTFAPAGQLTALQFGKMLLVEIGYDAKAAGMTGTDWAINTSKLLATTGLMKGIDGSVNQVLTREKAAQMTLNALKTPTVEYATKGSNITVNGAEINFGASVPTYVTNTVAKEQTISNDTLTNSKEYTIELGEKLFKKLILKPTTDAFERPTHTWTFENKKVGEYTEDADLTYTTSVKLGDIYSDLGLSEKIAAKDVVFYRNGNTEANSGKDSKNVALTEAAIAKKAENKIGANGVLTQVWYDSDKGTAIVTMIDTYVGEIGSVVKATSSADRYVNVTKVANSAGTKNPGALNTKFETEDFAKGDLITYTAAYNESTKKYDVQTVANLEKSFSGVLTAWKGTSVVNEDKGGSQSNFTVDGTKYEYNNQAVIATVDGFNHWMENDIAGFDVNKSEINVYLDQYGYALYITGVEGTKNYAAVIGIGKTNAYGSETRGATLLLPDGTKKEVTAKLSGNHEWTEFYSAAVNSVTPATNPATSKVDFETGIGPNNVVSDGAANLVTYTEEDGVYKLTPAGRTAFVDSNANGSITANATSFVNGRSLFVLDASHIEDVSSDTSYYTTSETVFFVATNKKANNPIKGVDYNVYVGYNNMPSLDDEKVYGVSFVTDSSEKQIEFVYIYAKELEGVSGVDTYFVKASSSKIITDSTGKYYVLPAIVDGEETEVKIDAQVVADFDGDGAADDAIVGATGMFAVDNVIKNSKGIIIGFNVMNKTIYTNPAKGFSATGTIAANAVVLGVGVKDSGSEVYWAYNDKTNVYVVDEDYETITVSSVKDVNTDKTDLVYATVNDVNSFQKVLVDVVIVAQPDDAAETYTVTFKPGDGANFGYGAYTANDDHISAVTSGVKAGSDFSFKLNPATGKAVKTVKVNNVALAPDASGLYTISGVYENKTIEVELTNVVTLTVKSNDTTKAAVTYKDTTKIVDNTVGYEIDKLAEGDTVTLTIVPASGMKITEVKANGNFVSGKDGVYTVTAIQTGDVVITMATV